MDFWFGKKQEASEGEIIEAAGVPENASAGNSSTALALRPIPADALILIPLRNAVLFPGVISPITIGRSSSVAAANEAARSSLKVGFVLQRDPQTDSIAHEAAIFCIADVKLSCRGESFAGRAASSMLCRIRL